MSVSLLLKRLAAAVLVPAVLLGVAEVVVRLTVHVPEERMFHRLERDGQVVYQRASSKNFPPYRTYHREKAPGAVRIACIGGSTVEGQPFPDAAFPAVLERLLAKVLAPRQVEVMAAGVGGYYSVGELSMLRELLDFDLDAVVLYSCHNEFHPSNVGTLLERDQHPFRSRALALVSETALGSWFLGATAAPRKPAPSLAERAPDHRPIDGPEYGLVVDHFRDAMEEFVGICRDRGIPLVMCTAVSNLSAFPPMYSMFDAGTSAADRARFEALLGEAATATDAGKPEHALELLEQARAIDGKPAGLEYQQGRALQAAGRPAEALAAFVAARDHDGRLNRAPTPLNEIVRSFAGRPGLLIADVEAMFVALSPHGIVSGEYIVDNVHPTRKGQRLIAELVFTTLAKGKVLIDESQLGSAALDAVLHPVEEALPQDEIDARIGRANLTLALEEGAASATSAVAREKLENARRLAPDRVDVVVDLAVLAGLEGRGDTSRELFAQALSRDSNAFTPWAAATRNSPYVAKLFRDGGVHFEGDRAVVGP